MSKEQQNQNKKYRSGIIYKLLLASAVFVFFAIVAMAQHVFTDPPVGICDANGCRFGNTSQTENNYVADNFSVMNRFGVVIGTFLDSYSCNANYCIYQPWYAPGQIYLKDLYNGTIKSTGTNITTIIETATNTDGAIISLNGNYIVPETIRILYKNTTIQCIRNNQVNLFLASGLAKSMFNVSGDSFEISGCNIDMNGANNIFPQQTESAVFVDYANYASIHDNIISSDTFTEDGNLIYFGSFSNGNQVYGNQLNGGRNNIFGYYQNRIYGNNMSGAGHLCVYLRIGRWNTITGNTCYGSNDGFGIDGSAPYNSYGNVISGNSISNIKGGSGVTLTNTSGNAITGNSIYSMQFNGVRINGAVNNSISGNTMEVLSKTASSSQGGVHILNGSTTIISSNNSIIGNTISDGEEYGIYILYPEVNINNKLYLNTILRSTISDYSGLNNQQYLFYNGTCLNSSNNGGACI